MIHKDTALIFIVFLLRCTALSPPIRRKAFVQISGEAILSVFTLEETLKFPAVASTNDDTPNGNSADDKLNYENRDRRGNKKALVREDIYYMSGKKPPRKLEALKFDDPKYNTWGSCTTSEGGQNSCTYIPLSQRIPGYSKYAFNIQLGSRDYVKLGKVLDEISASGNTSGDLVAKYWNQAASYLLPLTPGGSSFPPARDALLKMALMGTSMLTSPNYSGPPKELMIARYYVNELDFALTEILDAIEVRDITRAKAAWGFGKDSWNSYFFLVNRQIVPKVGDQFELIA